MLLNFATLNFVSWHHKQNQHLSVRRLKCFLECMQLQIRDVKYLYYCRLQQTCLYTDTISYLDINHCLRSIDRCDIAFLYFNAFRKRIYKSIISRNYVMFYLRPMARNSFNKISVVYQITRKSISPIIDNNWG